MSQKDLRVCPKCLNEKNIADKTCSYCKEKSIVIKDGVILNFLLFFVLMVIQLVAYTYNASSQDKLLIGFFSMLLLILTNILVFVALKKFEEKNKYRRSNKNLIKQKTCLSYIIIANHTAKDYIRKK